jgi:hypothetical protein
MWRFVIAVALLLAPASAKAAETIWYYCDAAQAYYPYVSSCPASWRPVAPQPLSPHWGAGQTPSGTDDEARQADIEAVRQQVKRCWNIPADPNLHRETLSARFQVTANPDQTVRSVELLNPKNDGMFQEFAESARQALLNSHCQPLMFPSGRKWKSITLTFSQSAGISPRQQSTPSVPEEETKNGHSVPRSVADSDAKTDARSAEPVGIPGRSSPPSDQLNDQSPQPGLHDQSPSASNAELVSGRSSPGDQANSSDFPPVSEQPCLRPGDFVTLRGKAVPYQPLADVTKRIVWQLEFDTRHCIIVDVNGRKKIYPSSVEIAGSKPPNNTEIELRGTLFQTKIPTLMVGIKVQSGRKISAWSSVQAR